MKAQRLQAKMVKEVVKISKKRSLEEKGSQVPRKRARISTTQARQRRDINEPRSMIDTTDIELQDTSTAIESDEAQAQRKRSAFEVAKSLPTRFGRRIRLPTRFTR